MIGLLAGSYHLFYLSSFRPVKVLRVPLEQDIAAIPERYCGSASDCYHFDNWNIIVYNQIAYTRNRPVGYDRESLINIKTLTPDIYQHF